MAVGVTNRHWTNVDFSLLDAVPDAIVIAHGDGQIAYVNAIAEELFGWRRSELIGRPIEILLPARFRAIHQVHRAGYQAAPRTRPMGLGLDLYGLKKNGEEFSSEISLAGFESGGETFVIAAVRDVTERKRLEQRAGLLRRAQEEVRERDEFLSIASHELRTPVAALQLQLQLLQRAAGRPGGSGPELMAHKVDALERQCRRIAVLVNELLDVSRLRLGRLELRLEELDLGEVVRDTVSHLQEEGVRLGSRIEVIAREPVVGRWDRVRIEQVITNLLSNALKFGQGKPVTVSVSTDGDRAKVAVRDEGIGIEQKDHSRVFERFERAAPTQHFGGLGLGLYISREIVEAHGGTIRLVSEPRAGTTFTVELPRTPPEPIPEATQSSARMRN